MNKITALSFFLLVSTFSGCDYFCPTGLQINPTFIGFAPADIDTLVYRAYIPDGTFQQLVDTELVYGAGTYTSFHDTTVVFVNNSRPHPNISYGFDWKIYIPAINRTILISNIDGSFQKNHGNTCLGPVHSFILDGQLINNPVSVRTDQFWTSGYRAYIHM